MSQNLTDRVGSPPILKPKEEFFLEARGDQRTPFPPRFPKGKEVGTKRSHKEAKRVHHQPT